MTRAVDDPATLERAGRMIRAARQRREARERDAARQRDQGEIVEPSDPGNDRKPAPA